MFAVPSGECLHSLRHRYSYGYGYGYGSCEVFHSLRFGSSSQLLLAASQERSGLHSGIVNLFWLGGPSSSQQQQQGEGYEGRSSFSKDHAAASPTPTTLTTTLRLEEEPDGFCCVTVSEPAGGRGDEAGDGRDCIQAATVTATQETPASSSSSGGGYGEFFRSAAAMAAESLGRAAGLSVRAVLGCRPGQGDNSLPVFHATLPKSSGDGPGPGTGQPLALALAIAEQRPGQGQGQVELLLAAGGGLLRRHARSQLSLFRSAGRHLYVFDIYLYVRVLSFKVPTVATHSASSGGGTGGGGGAALTDFLSNECRLLPGKRHPSASCP